MENIQIGQNLQKLRKERGLTQQEVAERINVSSKTVSKWECGNTLPDIFTLNALAQIYLVTVDEIINNKDAITEKKLLNSNDSIKNLYRNKYINKFLMWNKISYLILIFCLFLTYVLFILTGYSLISIIFSFVSGSICLVLYFLSLLLNKKDINFNLEDEKKLKKAKYRNTFIICLTSIFIMFVPIISSITITYNVEKIYTYEGGVIAIENTIDSNVVALIYFGIYLIILGLGILIVHFLNKDNSMLKKVLKFHSLYYFVLLIFLTLFIVMPTGTTASSSGSIDINFWDFSKNNAFIYVYFALYLVLILATVFLQLKLKNILPSYIVFLVLSGILFLFSTLASHTSEYQSYLSFIFGLGMLIFLVIKFLVYLNKKEKKYSFKRINNII